MLCRGGVASRRTWTYSRSCWALRPHNPIDQLLCRRYDSSIGVKGGKDKLWPATLEKGVVSACATGTAGTRAAAVHQPLQLLPRRLQPCSCMSARLRGPRV